MSNRPFLVLLLLATCVASTGCARWDRSKFDVSRLRDPRAIDIDSRLSGPPLDQPPRREE